MKTTTYVCDLCGKHEHEVMAIVSAPPVVDLCDQCIAEFATLIESHHGEALPSAWPFHDKQRSFGG